MSSTDASTGTTAAASASSTLPTSPASGSVAPAPASLPRPRGAGAYRVIMVCTGNICRSAMAEAVVVGRASRSLLNVPDPWYGTMADFVDTLEVVERVSDELADELAALLG